MVKFSDVAILEIDMLEREAVLYNKNGDKVSDEPPTVLVFAKTSPIGQAANLLIRLCLLAYKEKT